MTLVWVALVVALAGGAVSIAIVLSAERRATARSRSLRYEPFDAAELLQRDLPSAQVARGGGGLGAVRSVIGSLAEEVVRLDKEVNRIATQQGAYAWDSSQIKGIALTLQADARDVRDVISRETGDARRSFNAIFNQLTG